MNINPINNWNSSVVAQEYSKPSYSETFSKALDNFKNGKPVDYDEEKFKGQKTQTMTQILSDGSTLVTVYDDKGRIISQRKTAAAYHDPNLHIIGTKVESNYFGLEELDSLTLDNLNLISIQ